MAWQAIEGYILFLPHYQVLEKKMEKSTWYPLFTHAQLWVTWKLL